MSTDRLLRFYFPKLGVRLAWTRLEAVHREFARLCHAPAPVSDWLSQCSCAAALMISGIKLDGKLSVQVQSQGAIRLLFAECTHDGQLRGIARANDAATVVPAEFAAAFARGSLAITIEPEQGERYQGVVALDADGIAATFEGYFENSEQLPTRMRFASSSASTTGLIVQRIAQVGGSTEDQEPLDPDGWDRIQQLLNTLSAEELAEWDEQTLIHRLFHEETVLFLGPQSLQHYCPCSRERVSAMLLSIGHDEAIAAADASGFASIQCEFCNTEYRFDRVDIERLFHVTAPSPGSIQ